MDCLGDMTYKRYEMWTREGKCWSKWYPYSGEKYKYQLKPKLLNEYKEE